MRLRKLEAIRGFPQSLTVVLTGNTYMPCRGGKCLTSSAEIQR